MSVVANIVKNRPNDGAKVKGTEIRPASNEITSPANPSGGIDVEGTAGKDIIIGTNKRDVIRGNDGRDKLSGRARRDLISGEAGSDVIKGQGGRDTLIGGGGNDVIKGGRGKDLITGDQGNDKLIGNKGDDLIVGGKGDDLLRGGRGSDILEGGEGADTFLFKGSDFAGKFFGDVVADFVRGTDTISFESGGTRTFSGMSVGNDYVISVINKFDNLNGTITISGLGGQVGDVSGVTASQMSSVFG